MFLLTTIVIIFLVEAVFVYRQVTYGIAGALFLALSIYLALTAVKMSRPVETCAETLVLLPLYILFTSSLPWFFIDQPYQLPAVYTVVLGLAAGHVYQKKIDLKALFGWGKNKWSRCLGLGLVLGLPVGALEYFVITPPPALPFFTWTNLVRDLIYMVFFVGLGEELLFRGLIQKDLTQVFGWPAGLLLASLVFGVMHLTWRSPAEVGYTFLVALLLGYVYHRTNSLVVPVLVHGFGNVVLVAVMPYLV